MHKGKLLKKFERKVLKNLALAETLDQINNFVNDHVVIKFPETAPPTMPGLYRWFGTHWDIAIADEIGLLCVLDFESEEVRPAQWEPTVCAIYSTSHDGRASWFWWKAAPGDRVMPFPGNRIVVGHNVIAYDRRYLSCEYQDVSNKYFDTMQLANILGGIGGDEEDDGKHGALQAMWRTFDARRADGKSVPAWYNVCGPVNLAFLSERYLGVAMDKTVRDRLIADPTTVQPETLYQYCAGDVYQTARMFQVLWKKVNGQIVSSPITWYGMLRQGTARYYLKDWDAFTAQSEEKYQEQFQRLKRCQDKLVSVALEDPEREINYPGLDWSLYSRGQRKGMPKWIKVVEDSKSPLGSDAAVQLLRLNFNGSPVEWRKAKQGMPKWWAGDDPLPHPTGNGNLGDPLCKDYHVHALSGRLTSAIVPQEQLSKIFEILDSLSQWKSYRSRYANVYRQPVGDGLDLSVADLNTCGTVSRRSTSPLWVVLPKPNENKIGSNVMKHIVAPPGYKMVAADFAAQELRIAAEPITDCRAGHHSSSLYTKSILLGDKSKGTDLHTISAKRLGVSRGDAKGYNFGIVYGGGLKLITDKLITEAGLSRQQAEVLATEFYKQLKGRGGDAESTFKALNFLAGVNDCRTYLLGVQFPNSINHRYIPDDRSFVTLRNNINIQAAGVDEKHALITLIDYFASRRQIDCSFSCEIHDEVVYFCREDQTDDLVKIFQESMAKLIHLSLDQAAAFWDEFDPQWNLEGEIEPRQQLDPIPHLMQFEHVSVSDSLLGD